jgi:aryl-alcohol dehydrogenase-like predicted oxidoreductase
MRCPVCDELHREHILACEAEVTATLQQRYDMMLPPHRERADHNERQQRHLRGWSPFIGLQIEYSLIERTVERELIPMAKALSIGVTAWFLLARGVLTGKYHGHGGSSASPSEPGRMNNEP